MADRVLSTAAAEQAIQELQRIINGGLMEQINALNRQGTILSDQNVWDGQLAGQFRNQWPEINSSLNSTQQKLEELRNQVQLINQNIMTAGGNR